MPSNPRVVSGRVVRRGARVPARVACRRVPRPGLRLHAIALTLVGVALVVVASSLAQLGPHLPGVPAPSATAALLGQGADRGLVGPGYLSSRGGGRIGGLATAAPEEIPSPSAPEPEPHYTPHRVASSRVGERPGDAPPAVPTEEPRKVITYQVVAGDTLAGLAQRFGVSAETIVWANDLPDGGGVLRVGQELTIPPVSGVLYRVRKGDTLLAIALRHEVSPQEIIDANVLERPDLLSIDQQLIIPGARRVPPPASMPQTGSLQHRVARGETVTTIAQRYGVDAGAIVSANGLADPDMIRAGQLLLIPGVAAPPAAHEGAQPSPPPSDKGQEIAAIAAQFVGYRYVYGGTTPATGFDCSGFSMYVYGQAGISISRGLAGQLAAGRTVGRGELLPGDLVFFQNTFRAGLSHVGIYVGGGRFVHAASPPNGVRFDTLDMAYYDVRYYGASRPWE